MSGSEWIDIRQDEHQREILERLLKCDRRFKYTREETAARMGISSKGHVTGMLTGKKNITPEMLLGFAKAYGTTLEWLRDGNPRVCIWRDLIKTETYQTVGDLSATVKDRVSAVISYLNLRYPGHMATEDLAEHFGLPLSVILDVCERRTEPSDYFVRTLGELAGVEYGWLQIGNHHFVADKLPVTQWNTNRMNEWLALGHEAETNGIPLETVRAFVQTLKTNNKGVG